MTSITREVKIEKVSAGGVSLRVTFKNIGWLYGYEIKTYFAGISGGKDHISLVSGYFKTVEKAKEWINKLTQEVIAIKNNQMKLAKEFEEALATSQEIEVV